MDSISNEEINVFNKLINDTQIQSLEVLNFVKNIDKNCDDEQLKSRDKGISLLELKNQLMLNYLIDLTHLLLKKIDKKSIKDDPSVERLTETRVVFERLRPIEQKLKYQIDKLIKLATTGNMSDADPLRFKPKLDNFDANKESEDEDEDEEDVDSASDDGQRKKSEKYVPPKLMAMPYDDDDGKNRQMERAKKRALSSSLIQDLREQYSEAPEEIQEFSDHRRKKQLETQKRRTEYEEDNMMRIQLTKKQRQTERRVAVDSTLNSLLSFGDYNVEETMSHSKKKTPKKGQKEKGGKKKWKKRR